MTKREKLLEKARNSRHNMDFNDLIKLAESFGFTHRRTTGSHEMYSHPALTDQLNLQPLKNGKAKPYQIDQVVKALESLPKEDEA